MTIKFIIPDQIEQALRNGWGDVNDARGIVRHRPLMPVDKA